MEPSDKSAAAAGKPRLNLAERIQSVLTLEPARRAIEFQGIWHSWGELGEAMNRLEICLTGSGCGSGAPVAVLARNRPAHIAALVQVIRSRRCAVMMNPFQSPAKIAADLTGLNAAALIAESDDCRLPELQQVSADRGIPLIETGKGHALAVALYPEAHPGRRASYEAVPDIAVKMLTSGTTGSAKRVDLSYSSFERSQLDALFYEAGASATEVRLRDAVVIATTPVVHIGGLWAVVAAIVSGRAIALLEKFAVAEWRRVVVAYRPKVISLPPTALRMVYDANIPREELSSVLAVRSGASAMPQDLQEAFEERYGIPILDSYGATEFAGAVAGWTISDHKQFARDKRGSVGRAQPGCELRIVDRETFAVLTPGQVGLLEVKSPQQLGPDWIRTTDLAQIDTDGFLFLRGRADDAIARGGFKVLPGDITRALLQHPAVKEAGVVGLPDARLGAVPAAAVELRSGASASEAELLSFLRERLVAYQIPTQVRIVTELPRTPSMKVSQPMLRELLQTPAGKSP
jgi:acyl-CoA synthetase (AMP-forming)/AMP-acid ligase II